MDLPAHLGRTEGQGALWTHAGADLNVNLVAWPSGAGVAEHVNQEVDVLIIGVEGEGAVAVAGHEHLIRPGRVVLIPKGARRAIQSRSPRFAYLSVHRSRGGLRPTPRT
jgi:quercetin dioxygenase-like cupin family protein